jgi:hypothetical protein
MALGRLITVQYSTVQQQSGVQGGVELCSDGGDMVFNICLYVRYCGIQDRRHF